MSPERPPRARPRTALLAAAAAAAAVAAWGGCSVEKNYRLLSFFFDGVPEPGTIQAGGRRGGGASPIGGVVSASSVSAHSAFAERRCGDCHGDAAKFGLFATGFDQLDAGVCLKCHGGVVEETPLLHGPVAAQECLWCHQPHESPQPDLLVQPAPDLCLRCHAFQLGEAPRIAPHEDLQRDCLECHLGHGGPERFFLRPAAAPTGEEG